MQCDIDTEVDFEGLDIFIDTDNLDDRAFQTVEAGRAFSFNFDVAAVHNLVAGGNHKIQAKGRIPYAVEGSNKIAGYLKYTSNTIETTIDGAKAAGARLNFNNEPRANVTNCSGSKLSAINNAISECNRLAVAAQEAAASGSAGRMEEYFMSSSKSTRSTVSGGYSKVQDQCDSTSSGQEASCEDASGHCDESGALAYTHNGDYMVYCDPFFNNLGASPSTCHQKSRATTFLHETTHLSAVKRTKDLAYGYDALRKLSNSDAMNNADTYALFSNAVDLDCSIPSDHDEEE